MTVELKFWFQGEEMSKIKKAEKACPFDNNNNDKENMLIKTWVKRNSCEISFVITSHKIHCNINDIYTATIIYSLFRDPWMSMLLTK